MSSSTLEIWSVGHSTLALCDFVTLLRAHHVELLVDIRTVPKSRRHPQFRDDALAASLPAYGVGYLHLARLGGWRRTSHESENGAWRNASFRGYADYALTEEFAAGFAELCDLARRQRTAMMCSEALWWRCHRRLVADRVVAGGGRVRHISAAGRVADHELASFAVVDAQGRITYPAVAEAPVQAPT